MITAREPWNVIEPIGPQVILIVPPCPEDEMPDRVLELLDQELQYRADQGAFRPSILDLDEIDQIDLEAAIERLR